MNRIQRNSLSGAILVSCAIGMAGAVPAQDSPSADNQNRQGSPAAIPPTGSALSPTTFDSAETVFSRYDTARKGYLTKDQVQALDGFAFEAADLNLDGKLTADEFSKAWADYSSKK